MIILRIITILSLFNTSFSLAESNDKVVKTMKPIVQEVYDTYYAFGNCEAYESADVKSQVTGEIDKITSKQGKEVRKGDFIMSINQKIFNSEYKLAKEAAESNSKDHERNKELYKKKIISDNVFEKSRLTLLSAQSAYDKAHKQLDNAVIKASITGKLSVITHRTGDIVKPGEQLFYIITPKSNKELLLYIPEEIVRKLSNNSSISLGNKDGKIIAISPNASSKGGGNILVRALFQDKEDLLISGSYVTATLKLDSHKATTIPESAIMQGNIGKYLYIVTPDHKIKKLTVETGYRIENMIEVKDLPIDTKVVVLGINKVNVGDKVLEQ
jgi:RND family efflux transporter MFP subunit